MLILIRFPFQQYISFRHLNFDRTCENKNDSDFSLFWKSENVGLVHNLAVCTKIFLEDIGLRTHKNVKQELSLDLKILTGLYCRAGTNPLEKDNPRKFRLWDAIAVMYCSWDIQVFIFQTIPSTSNAVTSPRVFPKECNIKTWLLNSSGHLTLF